MEDPPTLDELKMELNVAFNEATLLGAEVDAERRVAAVTLDVLTLPSEGPPPEDSRVQLILHPVGRVAASWRMGSWDDPNAEVVPFPLERLLEVVQSFGGQPIYGWEFLDAHDKDMARLRRRLSLDWRSGEDGLSHSLSLFQESASRKVQHLDLFLWFDELVVRRPDGTTHSLEDFAAGGQRWWDALYAGDQRTEGQGISPLRKGSEEVE